MTVGATVGHADRRVRLLWRLIREFQVGVHDPESLPQRLTDALHTAGGFAGTSILLPDETGDALVVTACSGLARRWGPATVPRGRGVSWEVYRSGRSEYVFDLTTDPRTYPPVSPDSVGGRMSGVYLPLEGKTGVVGVLVIHAAGRDAIPPEDRELLALVGPPIALAIETARLYEALSRAVSQRDALLQTTRTLADGSLDLEPLCQRAVEEAVALVPGAERGSLSIREADGFAFVAGVGYDVSRLREVRFSEEDRLKWYGLDASSLRQGTPRILSGEEARARVAQSRPAAGWERIALYGAMASLRSTLGVPIVLDGRLEAFLNLDNHSRSDAFGRESVEVARMFADQVAAILKGVRLRELLSVQARTDPLTGLYNRRYLEERLVQEIHRALRGGHRLSVLLVDAVGLKAINDTLGHRVGDELLVAAASQIRAVCRRQDVACRFGGDEFVVILPDTSLPEAEVAARRLLAGLPAATARWQGGIQVTVGIASLPEHGDSASALLASADRHMYQARRRGLEYFPRTEVRERV
ncbi:MAG: diguanylate cyclase [Armatimonadota bacterium]|nr:diguanylate cyclase [Armatimonadota bacterium]MDR5697299.1 diguanylate cyclase [Armatimonadota bacterium]